MASEITGEYDISISRACKLLNIHRSYFYYEEKKDDRPQEPNTTWSLDFVSDAVECGRKFRVLNIIDDCDRLAIAQEVSMSMPAKRVIKILEKVIWLNGKPKNIRCDNGPEFIAADFQNWCRGNEINILFI